MTFLINAEEENHLHFLIKKLKDSTEALFAVAFLKVSGLNLILAPLKSFLEAGGTVFILAGKNFALTEPQALHTLRQLFSKYPTANLYLDKALSPSAVFHPKLYLFQSKNECCVVSGSANLTKGGLTSNKESSLAVDCQGTDKLWVDAKQHFEQSILPANADKATLFVIKQYETYFEQQKKHNKQAKSTQDDTSSRFYDALREHFQDFNNLNRSKDYREKVDSYKEAERVLDAIADAPRLTQKQFEPLLDHLVGSKEQYSLWYSGSLFRLRRSVYPHFKEFRELVRYIRTHKNQEAATLFDGAKQRVEVIKGASVNYIAEIMMTYNRKQFANLNKNPLYSLKVHGGANIKSTAAAYTGADYQEYCEIVKEISNTFGLKDMLEADSFFNNIYWGDKEPA